MLVIHIHTVIIIRFCLIPLIFIRCKSPFPLDRLICTNLILQMRHVLPFAHLWNISLILSQPRFFFIADRRKCGVKILPPLSTLKTYLSMLVLYSGYNNASQIKLEHSLVVISIAYKF